MKPHFDCGGIPADYIERMLTAQDQHRARVAAGDPAEFLYRSRRTKGIVIRTNPKRAVVRVENEEFNVPYELLLLAPGTAAQREERIECILNSARSLIAGHGLQDWHFKFDHGTRRAGCCSYHDKTITLSFDLARTSGDAELRDTLLHEIAHALVGKKHNHDAVWKEKALEIGCSAERTHRLEFSPPRWNVTCENRCWTQTANRRNSRLICRRCGSKLVYTPHG